MKSQLTLLGKLKRMFGGKKKDKWMEGQLKEMAKLGVKLVL